MPFPPTLEALTAAGYLFVNCAKCPRCGEDTQVFKSPVGREIVMDPMHMAHSAAVRHYETCGKAIPLPTAQETHSETLPPEFPMSATRGKNVIGVGWRDGVLRVCFPSKDGRRFGRYFGVPEAELAKLKRSPFPDKLFSQNIKTKYRYEKEA